MVEAYPSVELMECTIFPAHTCIVAPCYSGDGGAAIAVWVSGGDSDSSTLRPKLHDQVTILSL